MSPAAVRRRFRPVSGYVARLIRKGYRVAICEQTEDPSKAKKLVRREVVRVITPGTAIDAHLVEAKESLYLAAICGAGDTYFDLQPNGRYSFMEEQGRWTLKGDRLTIEVTHASSDSGTEVGQRNTSRVRRLGANEAEWTREGGQPVRVTRCP